MKKTRKYLLLSIIIFVIFSIIFFAKSSNFLIDFSREVTIPYQMFEGKKLFKDIFLIYGFFGYFANFLLYKVSPNINILIIEANIISFIIFIFNFFILKKFINNKKTLIFSFFFIICSIFSYSTFSFLLPYSFSTLWSIFTIYGILFSLLYKKERLLYLLLGLLLISKIEYFTLVFLAVLIFKIYKKEKFNLNSLLIFIFPTVFLGYVLINKISINDILSNIYYLKKMVKTLAIAHLYKGLGTYFEKRYFIYNIKNLLIITLTFFVANYFKQRKILSMFLVILGFCFVSIAFSSNLILIPLMISALILIKKKRLKTKELILLVFVLIINSKSLFAINSLNYANYGFILTILCLYIYLSKIFSKKFISHYFLIFGIFLGLNNIIQIEKDNKQPLKINNQMVYINKLDFSLFKKINEFIKNTVKKEENFIVVPEGQIFNFIHKKSYNFYNSTFTPLDFETFGEENIIEQLKNQKTDYIIFYPRNTIDYGKQTICFDYAVDFCEYIIDNYDRIKIIDDNYKVLIFKKKNEKK